MKPGSLRIVAMRGMNERLVDKFQPGKASEDEFYSRLDYLDHNGWNYWLYEMTDKGWTEF